MKYIIAVVLFFSLSAACAQDERTQEYLRQEEQRKKSALLRELDSAVVLMEEGLYEKADQKYKNVLANLKSVPSDLTFYFGKNSLMLNQYKQSVDWLTKYIQLKGTEGQFSDEAATLLKRAEEGLIKEKSISSEKAGDILSKSYDIDCGPNGKVSCPVCKGDHVIIKKGAFGDEYRTCPYCNDHGLLTCEEYNKLLKGTLEKRN